MDHLEDSLDSVVLLEILGFQPASTDSGDSSRYGFIKLPLQFRLSYLVRVVIIKQSIHKDPLRLILTIIIFQLSQSEVLTVNVNRQITLISQVDYHRGGALVRNGIVVSKDKL